MLTDKLRSGAQGPIFKVIFWIIILSFVFTGVYGYLIPRMNTDPVAVGKYKITANDWNQQYNQRAQELQRSYGSQVMPLLENKDYVRQLKLQVLEQMVDNVAFNAAVYDYGIRIGDEQIRDVIRTTPAFQREGKFDNDLYLAAVRNMGMSPEYFAEQLRVSVMAQTVSDRVMRTASFPLPYELRALAKVLEQSRLVDLYTVDRQSVIDKITVNDDEVKAYYDANQNQFMAPASVKFNYILLTLDGLKSGISYTEEDLENYLAINENDFKGNTERRYSQITVKADNPRHDEILSAIDEALMGGTDFGTVAAQYSDADRAAETKGDLGFVVPGQMKQNLETAADALVNVGDVTARITDEDGSYYVCLTETREQQTPDLARIHDQVADAYVTAQARELYSEKLNTMSDLSFENPDSLDVTAQAVELAVQNSGEVEQGNGDLKWPLNLPEVQDAAFDEDNLTSGMNTNVITLGDAAAIVLNIYDHQEAMVREYDEVKEQARELVTTARVNEQALAVLKDLAGKVSADRAAALPEGVSVESSVRLNRGDTRFEPLFALEMYALDARKSGSYVIAANQGVETLAVLREVIEPSAQSVDYYMRALGRQVSLHNGNRADRALSAAAREEIEIEYDQDAIALVVQDNGSAE